MNLTTLANVRQWLNLTTDTDNQLVIRLIADASRMIMNYLQRAELGYQTITETISGRGERKLQLRNWPVLAVNSLTVNGVVIPATNSTQTSWGYFLEPVYGSVAGRPQNVGVVYGAMGSTLIGSNPQTGGVVANFGAPYGLSGARTPFCPGVGNIIVSYAFGYCSQKEPQTIPAGSPYTITPNQTYGSFAQDLGVTFAVGGAALTAVSANPTSGQYVPPNLAGDNPTLVYTFATADEGKGVLLNYNFVPYDIEQACIEIVAERYKYKGRIGEASRSMGGQETASYMVKDAMTAAIKSRLDPYKLVWGG